MGFIIYDDDYPSEESIKILLTKLNELTHEYFMTHQDDYKNLGDMVCAVGVNFVGNLIIKTSSNECLSYYKQNADIFMKELENYFRLVIPEILKREIN
jgi:hypothetical protein